MITEKSLQDIIGYVFLGSACTVCAVFGFYIIGGNEFIKSIKGYIKNKYVFKSKENSIINDNCEKYKS